MFLADSKIIITSKQVVYMLLLILFISFSAAPIVVEAQIIVKEKVEETTMMVIVANINSPWNGYAKYVQEHYFYWKFGSLSSKIERFTKSRLIEAYDGRNALLAQFARVAIYDVYDCDYYMITCTYLGKIAEVVEWLSGVYGTYYEEPGDKLDDTCYKIVTSDQYGNILGSHIICPIYVESDNYYILCNGFTFAEEIYEKESYEFSFSMGITVKNINLDGVVKGDILSGSVEYVQYKFVAPSTSCATWQIDYLGPYSITSNRYPIEWAFSVTSSYTTYSLTQVSSQKPSSYIYIETHLVNEKGKLIRKYIDKVDYETILGKNYRKKSIDINLNQINSMIIISPVIFNNTSIKNLEWKIWIERTNNMEFNAAKWGSPHITIPVTIMPELKFVECDPNLVVKVVLVARTENGLEDIGVVFNGYAFMAAR